MATPPDDLISPPDDLVSEEVAPTDLVSPPDDLVTPEEPKPEKSFQQKYMEFDNAKDAIIIDAMDVVASTPAWLGGMGAGILAAAYKRREEDVQGLLGMEKTPGGMFGAAQAVKEGVLEAGGNPIRRSLTAIGAFGQPKEGEHTSIVAKGMSKIGEALHAEEQFVSRMTGSEDLGKGASFFTEMLAPSIIHRGSKGVYVGGAKVVTKAKDAIVKTPEVKEVDPAFQESRIKPEESIADVIQRKYERDALARKIDEGEATMGEPLPAAVRVDGETPVVTNKTRDTALAHTDKEGNITLNDVKIETDFKEGFPYIFDATTETGKQKTAVFEQIGVTKEDFAKAIPDVATYKDFLKAHEESHVKNGDRGVYPRTADGKADLMHPDAIKIEARATIDALKAINKQTPADAVMANVYEFITKEKLDHAASLESASLIIEKSLNNIIADSRLVDIRVKGILDMVPDVTRREQITRSLEAEHKGDVLSKSATKSVEVLKDIRDYLKEIGDRAIQVGLMTELRNNYVPHVLDFSKSKLTPKKQADFLANIANAPKESKLVRDFTQQRTFEFLRELEKTLVGTGVVVHTDIAKIVEAYGKSMHTAIIQKTMIDYLKTTKAADGNPFIMLDSPLAKGLKYVSFESVGSKAIADLRVHPDLADSMGFMFRERDPSVLVRALGGVNNLTKAMNVVGSLFHLKSLAEAGFLTSPSLFAKELMTAGSGMKAALRAFEHEGKNPLIDLLIREGGLMIKVEDVQRTIIADTGTFLDNLATRAASKTGVLADGKSLNLVQHITNPVDKQILQRLNVWTWDYAHTAQKINVATHLFTKMKLKNPEIPDATLAKEVSLYVNNTFGGLNWLQVANSVNSKFGRALALKMAGIAGRDWAQIVLFAPDWTVSTLRAVTTALPRHIANPKAWQLKEGVKGIANPKTHSDLARRYVINTALTWLTIINGINMMSSGKPVWDNKDPTRIELADGTSMQAAKHSMEAAHWLMAPDKTLGNKLGLWPKVLFVFTTGVAYPSPDAPKLKDTTWKGRARGVGLLALPFAVSTAVQAPEGQAGKRALLSTLGLPIYGVSPEQMKKSQAKGRAESKKKKLEAKRNK